MRSLLALSSAPIAPVLFRRGVRARATSTARPFLHIVVSMATWHTLGVAAIIVSARVPLRVCLLVAAARVPSLLVVARTSASMTTAIAAGGFLVTTGLKKENTTHVTLIR